MSEIISIKYSEKIKSVCESLPVYSLGTYFVCYLLFNNGDKFIMSNMPELLETYYGEGLFNEDYSVSEQIIENVPYYLCDTTASVSDKLKTILENDFNIYRRYYMIRRAPECTMVFGVAGSKQESCLQNYYHCTYKNLEDFALYFIDIFINIVKYYNPTYKNSVILNDDYYRERIIKNKLEMPKLSEREKSCLRWAAQGKTTEETSIILNIKKSTVETYRTEAKRKLDVSNMSQAIYEAFTLGLLGSYGANIKTESGKYTNLINQ